MGQGEEESLKHLFTHWCIFRALGHYFHFVGALTTTPTSSEIA
jgi:hypothetical protein